MILYIRCSLSPRHKSIAKSRAHIMRIESPSGQKATPSGVIAKRASNSRFPQSNIYKEGRALKKSPICERGAMSALASLKKFYMCISLKNFQPNIKGRDAHDASP